ncbi:MAG: GDP-mannose 4,6-dehydratase [Chloroflexaceae bacterium]|nr:GDP-mannose 4,6-dehydratase [Chloroflexaceae bacterium]
MRALITGINGFAGSHLADYLVARGGWDIWGLARKPVIRWDHLQDDIRLVCADLTCAEDVSRVLQHVRPQVIFHLAGQAFVPLSFRQPASTISNNVFGLLSLFLAIIEHGLDTRVLTVGSYEQYGLIQPEDLPIDEQTPLRPCNPYGTSKIAQDMLALQYYFSHGIDVVRVRPFNHIGPRQDVSFVAPAFAHQIAAIELGIQPPVLQVGDLRAQRDFTDVRDMVRAYYLAIESGQSGDVYNIGSGHALSVQTLLDHLLAASQVKITVEPDPERMRPINVPLVVCDASRLQQHTGWSPAIPFAQTIHDILEDWRLRTRMNLKAQEIPV